MNGKTVGAWPRQITEINYKTHAIHSMIQWMPVTQPYLGGGKTEALGVKTTADPRGTARTLWAARGRAPVPSSTDETSHLPCPSDFSKFLCRPSLAIFDQSQNMTIYWSKIHTPLLKKDVSAIICVNIQCWWLNIIEKSDGQTETREITPTSGKGPITPYIWFLLQLWHASF